MTSNTPDHGGRDDHPRDQLSSLREAKRVHIQLVLEKVAWNKKQAAKILEISRGTLYRKIAEYHYGASQPGLGTRQVELFSCQRTRATGSGLV